MSSDNQKSPNDRALAPRLPSETRVPSVGFVSTYPPTMCGLATFTASLLGAMEDNRGTWRGLDVLELSDDASHRHPNRPEVIATVDPADLWSLRGAARVMSEYDAVILQHEYGIWGPDMGAAVLEFIDRLESELITNLHTLLSTPSPTQRRIIEALVDRSSYTVVPTKSAEELLSRLYRVDPDRVAVIPHGVDAFHASVARLRSLRPIRDQVPRLLTWGLIGPGKGLEWSLIALGLLKRRYPDVRYTIAGKTHPKVLSHEGESYRSSLEAIVSGLDLGDNVDFVDEYVSRELLRQLLLETSIVVLPYDSTEQIVSGVLVEAVASNVPVVATQFPHSIELAEYGAVAAVPHRSPAAIAHAVDRLWESSSARGHMVEAQRLIASELEWHSVARQYDQLVEEAVTGVSAISHVSSAS